jgi:hypothetical protein
MVCGITGGGTFLGRKKKRKGTRKPKKYILLCNSRGYNMALKRMNY